MIYYNLITRPIQFIDQEITEDIVIKALEMSFKNCAFSTFPYVMEGLNSEQSLEKYNSGNCIALSMYIQNYLNDHYNIKSYLIPATIPDKYKFEDYLTISHVALAIPINKNQAYIADSAFYFLNPILIDFNNNNSQIVYSKNIYSYENSKLVEEYSTIEKIISRTKRINNTTQFNKWQSIAKGTYYSHCYYNDDPLDTWNYFLCEIVNPDQAISTFFINIRQDPFITTCFMDNQGVCKCRYYIKVTDSMLHIEKYSNKKRSYFKFNLDHKLINNLEDKLKRFFKGKFKIWILRKIGKSKKKIYKFID